MVVLRLCAEVGWKRDSSQEPRTCHHTGLLFRFFYHSLARCKPGVCVCFEVPVVHYYYYPHSTSTRNNSGFCCTVSAPWRFSAWRQQLHTLICKRHTPWGFRPLRATADGVGMSAGIARPLASWGNPVRQPPDASPVCCGSYRMMASVKVSAPLHGMAYPAIPGGYASWARMPFNLSRVFG